MLSHDFSKGRNFMNEIFAYIVDKIISLLMIIIEERHFYLILINLIIILMQKKINIMIFSIKK